MKCTECNKKRKAGDERHGPLVGICGTTGASYDTVASVLDGWSVTALLHDGSTVTGWVKACGDDMLHLQDWDDLELVEWAVIPFDSIKYININ